MKNNTMKFNGVITAFSALLSLSMPSLSYANDFRSENSYDEESTQWHNGHYKKRIRAVTVTGVNSVLGQPFFDWGEAYGGTFNFPTMGVYNENGSEPLPLDENTPDSAILSSYIDPLYLFIAGKPADYVVNPDWINKPLRDVAVNTDFAYVEKRALRSIREAEVLELSQTEPTNDITLGQWMEARGVVKIDCSDGGADLKMRFKNLIPKRMYSVWANMGLPPQPGVAPTIYPIAVGGAPNIFITDEDGDATFKRWINFCPIDPQATENLMLNIDIYYLANQENYGAVIAPGFWRDGYWPGVITFSHLVFPINVELLSN